MYGLSIKEMEQKQDTLRENNSRGRGIQVFVF